MTDELLAAHRAGRVEVAIGRASDYFGPGTTSVGAGRRGLRRRAGRPPRAQVIGRPDLPHSYSYTPDVAAALITLATEPEATGSVWHLPIAETRTTRQIIEHVYRLAGTSPVASPPAARRCAWSGWSSRRCVSTSTRSTSSPSAGSSTTAGSVPRSAIPRRPSTTPSPPLSSGTATPPGAAHRLLTTHTRGQTMNMPTTRRLAAVAMAGAAALAIAGFTALGSVFDYPAILKSPTAEILSRLSTAPGRRHRLVPRAGRQRRAARTHRRAPRTHRRRPSRGVDRRHRHRRRHGPGRRALAVGAPRARHQRRRDAASRTADARHTFELLHTWLGEVVGETIGYALTATFTVLVVATVTRRIAPRWMTLGRLHLGGAHRHRRRHPARRRVGRPDQLRRLRRLVPLARRHGNHPLAIECGDDHDRPEPYALDVLRISVLGPVEVRRDGRLIPMPAGKTSELLVRLALDAGLVVSADRLVEDLRADDAIRARRNTLQSKVSQLRRALADPALVASGDTGYRLVVDPSGVDALAVLRRTADAAQLFRSAMTRRPWSSARRRSRCTAARSSRAPGVGRAAPGPARRRSPDPHRDPAGGTAAAGRRR